MVMTLYDIKMIHVEPKDQNKSTRDNQAYLRMKFQNIGICGICEANDLGNDQ